MHTVIFCTSQATTRIADITPEAAAASAAEPTHSGMVLLRYEIKGDFCNGRGAGGFRRDLLPSR